MPNARKDGVARLPRGIVEALKLGREVFPCGKREEATETLDGFHCRLARGLLVGGITIKEYAVAVHLERFSGVAFQHVLEVAEVCGLEDRRALD